MERQMSKRNKKPVEPKPPEKISPDKLFNEPITLQVDGKDYKIDRIRISDMNAVYARIRDNRINAVLRNCAGAPSFLYAKAIAEAAAIDPTQDNFWSYIDTAAGGAFITHKCMTRAEFGPEQMRLTLDQVEALIEKCEGLKHILFSESGLVAPPQEPEENVGDENGPPFSGEVPFGTLTPKELEKMKVGLAALAG